MPRARQRAYTSPANDFNFEKIISMRLRFCLPAATAIAALFFACDARSQQPSIVIPRGNSTIVLEPYAPNVIRVTLSLDKEEATAAPGYGIVATPAPAGWTYQETEDAHIYQSSRLVVTLLGGSGRSAAAATPSEPTNVQKTQASIGKFFNGSAPWADIRFSTPD